MKKLILFSFLVLFLLSGVSAGIFDWGLDDGENQVLMQDGEEIEVPEGFDLQIGEEGGLFFFNKNDGAGNFIFKGISMLVSKGSGIKYVEGEEGGSLFLEGEGNLEIGDTMLNNIQDAEVSFDLDKQINFAEFTAIKKETYDFNYEDTNYHFNAKQGGKVLFDPKKKVIKGNNVDFDFDNKFFKGENIELILGEKEGDIEKIRISKGGEYFDALSETRYTSKEDFSLYKDGRDISNLKNSISLSDEFGNVQAIGKIKIENGILYEGLTDTTYFKKELNFENELISIDSREDGKIATFSKKFKIGNLNPGEKFISGENQLNSIISKENGKINFQIDSNSIETLGKIEMDPNKVSLFDRNVLLDLGDGEAFFGAHTDKGMIYMNRDGSYAEILSPSSTHKFLGNELDTVKEIVHNEIKVGTENIQTQTSGINKIYEMQKRDLVSYENGDERSFQAGVKSFDSTKRFIDSSYPDGLERDVAMTSFIADNFNDVGADDFSNREQVEEFELFKKNNLNQMKSVLDESDLTKIYSLDSGNLNDLSVIPESHQDSFGKLLQNNIVYENLAETSLENYEYNSESVVNSYRGLIHLEDMGVSNQNTFSTKKLNLMEGLAIEYSENRELGDALAVMDEIQSDYKSYINELGQQIDFNDPSNAGIYSSLKNLNEKIVGDNIYISQKGFNEIQLELYSQEGKIDEALELRKTYSERLSQAETGAGKALTATFGGGLGKDIVKAAGGFDDVKDYAGNLKKENQIYSQGSYGIQSLHNMGVPGETIDKWINGDMTEVETRNLVDQLLVKSGRTTFSPEIGDTGSFTGLDDSITGNMNRYSFSKEDQEIVYGFLSDVKGDAVETYNSNLYGGDIRKLIGVNNINYNPGEYQTYDYLDIDRRIQSNFFNQQFKELEMNKAEQVLNFVDQGLSPGVIVIGAATGGFGGTFFSGATGVTGALAGIAENLVIDAAAGSILVSAGVDPYTQHGLAAGTAVGVGILTGTPRIFNALGDSSSSLTKNVAKGYSNLDAVENKIIMYKNGFPESKVGDFNFYNKGSSVKSLDEINDFNQIKRLDDAERELSNLIREGLRDPHNPEFIPWYTGNYNPETGKITLYRYVTDYEGFDKVLSGESDLLPRGYINYGSEEGLIEKLESIGFNYDAELLKKSINGEDVSELISKRYATQGDQQDIVTYWSTSEETLGDYVLHDIEKAYRIKVELEPDQAFRKGGFVEKRFESDIGFEYDHINMEWNTIGPVSKESITEITNLNTGAVFSPASTQTGFSPLNRMPQNYFLKYASKNGPEIKREVDNLGIIDSKSLINYVEGNSNNKYLKNLVEQSSSKIDFEKITVEYLEGSNLHDGIINIDIAEVVVMSKIKGSNFADELAETFQHEYSHMIFDNTESYEAYNKFVMHHNTVKPFEDPSRGHMLYDFDSEKVFAKNSGKEPVFQDVYQLDYDEFLADAIGNPEFARYLDEIPWNNHVDESVYDVVVDGLCDDLGLVKKRERTVFRETLKKYLEEQNKLPQTKKTSWVKMVESLGLTR